MSIGNVREVVDKSEDFNLINYLLCAIEVDIISTQLLIFLGGQPCAAFDVAINSDFFQKVDPYNEVMVTTIIEAVAIEHELDLNGNGQS